MRAALALSILLLVGCGSTNHASASKADYEHRMAAVAPGLQGALLKGRLALESVQVPSVARRELSRMESQLQTGIAKLDATRPPKDVEAEHARLVAGYRAVLADLRSLTTASNARSTDKLRVQAARLATGPALKQVGAALRAILARGYDLGFPPGS